MAHECLIHLLCRPGLMGRTGSICPAAWAVPVNEPGGMNMKVKINCQVREFPPGTKFETAVRLVRESQKDDPVTQSIIAETGQDHISFVLNGRFVKPREYASLELKDGDDIRWMHPYAGG